MPDEDRTDRVYCEDKTCELFAPAPKTKAEVARTGPVVHCPVLNKLLWHGSPSAQPENLGCPHAVHPTVEVLNEEEPASPEA